MGTRMQRWTGDGQEPLPICLYPYCYAFLSLLFLHWLYPESISGEMCSEASDIWSAGLTLYYLATGQLPFDGVPSSMLFMMIRMPLDAGFWELYDIIVNKPLKPLPSFYSPEFQDFLDGWYVASSFLPVFSLNKDPFRRLTSQQLLVWLSSPSAHH